MVFEDYQQKESVIIVFTGDGKGKTSASLGLLARALGNRFAVAYIQFIKYWGVGEHAFIRDIQSLYKDKLFFYKGGLGFYKAGKLSDEDISPAQHKKSAITTYNQATKAIKSNKYKLVLCDEINNSVHDGLLTVANLKSLILLAKKNKINLCLTGRNFPNELLDLVDIATDMSKIKHHFDDKFLANKGIDY